VDNWAVKEADALQREYKRDEELRNGSWATVLAGTSLMKPLQKKLFRAKGKEVWASYQYEGKDVDLMVMVCITPIWALMAAEALNERQNQMEAKDRV